MNVWYTKSTYTTGSTVHLCTGIIGKPGGLTAPGRVTVSPGTYGLSVTDGRNINLTWSTSNPE
jgi:hypothetical protein